MGRRSGASFHEDKPVVGGQHATATLYDNATMRDFAALLPLGKVSRNPTYDFNGQVAS